MKVKFNLELDVSLSDIEVEAKSYEEALNKLRRMSVEDLVDGGYVESYETSDEEGEVTERSIVANVTDIEYDIDEDSLADGVTVADVLNELPTSMKVTLEDIDPSVDLTSLISDAIEDETGTFVNDFDYEIVKEF